MDAPVERSAPPPILPSKSGLAIASLILGILALCLSFFLVGGLLGLIGFCLGAVCLRRRQGSRALAWWGTSLSVVGLLVAIGFGILYFQAFKKFQAIANSGRTETNLADWEGVTTPDFTVTSLDGQKLTLSDLKGKRVVLDFWATWCPPCRKEIPHFIRLANETSRADLVIVGLGTEPAPALAAFAKKNGIPYPIATTDKLPAPYDNIPSIPTTFFIDRQGTIQKVAVGYHDYETLKSYAVQPDYAGAPKAKPARAVSLLPASAHPLTPVAAWSATIPDVTAICAGNWAQTGGAEILVADSTPALHVLDLNGVEQPSVPLPDRFALIECGQHKTDGPRLLGYSNWGHAVTVMDRHGKKLWSYSSLSGVDGAHWGDLDGDGTDELIVGMNGGGGLQAVDATGNLLWKMGHLGNVWNQAVIPARAGQPGLVLATEAGGTVKVCDAKGNLLRTLRPLGQYCTQLSAAVVDPAGTVQAIAIGENKTMAFDTAGVVAWSTPSGNAHKSWRNINFAVGDLTGDGHQVWAFLEASGDLVVVNAQGEKLATLPDQKDITAFVIATPHQGRGILVTVKSNTLQAYRFE